MDDTTLERWEAVDADGVRLLTPPGWTPIAGEFGAALAVRAPEGSIEGFHANLNVVRRDGTMADLDELLAVQIAELELLVDAQVVDAEVTDLAGRPATRTLVAYRSDDTELTLEQWLIPAGGDTLTISATSATSNHVDAGDTLAAIVGTLEIRV